MWKKLWKGTKMIFLIGLVGCLVILGINAWVVLSTTSRIHANPKDVPKRKVAVVLGTSKRVSSGYMNIFFTTRMDAAADLYKAGKVEKLLVSGDNSIKGYDEPSDMRAALMARGVPSRDIVLDYAGFRTFDSVVRARDVFGQDSVIFVSQRFHVQRAIFIAGSKGIDGIGYAADDPNSRSSVIKIKAREWLARVKAFLDCYILGTEARFPGPPEPIRFG